MDHGEKINDLFTRYAAEVGRHLPQKGRDDIQREILATLQDRLDDIAERSGHAADEDQAVALLKETGNPKKTAASYAGRSTLVGPELYALFALICRIALPIIGVIVLVVTTVSYTLGGVSTAGLLERIIGILGGAAASVLQAFAVIVIVFAVIERFTPKEKLAGSLESLYAWDPRALPPVTAAKKIDTGEQIATMAFGTVWIAALIYFGQMIPPYSLPFADLHAALSAGVLGLVPFLIASTAADVLAAAFLLARGRHTVATTAARAAAKVLGIISTALMLSVWPYVGLSAEAEAGVTLGVDILNKVIRGGLILAIIVETVELAKLLVTWFRGRLIMPSPREGTPESADSR